MSESEIIVIDDNSDDDLMHINIKENRDVRYSDPAPTAYVAFGISVLLISIQNLGFWSEADGMLIAVTIIFGGAGQILCGVLEYFRNNTFGLVVFCSYGSFFTSLGLVELLPSSFRGLVAPGSVALAFYLFAWTLFTLFPLWATFKHKPIHILQIIFSLLLIMLILLCIAQLMAFYGAGTAGSIVKLIGGIVGIVLGLLVMYLFTATMINENIGSACFPVDLKIEVNKIGVFAEKFKKVVKK